MPPGANGSSIRHCIQTVCPSSDASAGIGHRNVANPFPAPMPSTAIGPLVSSASTIPPTGGNIEIATCAVTPASARSRPILKSPLPMFGGHAAIIRGTTPPLPASPAPETAGFAGISLRKTGRSNGNVSLATRASVSAFSRKSITAGVAWGGIGEGRSGSRFGFPPAPGPR